MRRSALTTITGLLAAALALAACGSNEAAGVRGLGEKSGVAAVAPSTPAPSASALAPTPDADATATAEASEGALAADEATATPSPSTPACPARADDRCPDDADLAGADLSGKSLARVVLRGANLSGANLTNTDLTGADLAGADLRGARLRGARLNNATLSKANLTGLDLGGAVLASADLTDARLADTTLTNADLTAARLAGATLTGANLTGAGLSRTDLRTVPLAGRDLSRANLERANLAGSDLSNATLTGASLRGADLTGTRLPTVAPADPSLAAATLCRTKLAGGVIDSSSCPCTSAGGGAYGGDDPLLGTIALGAYPFTPYGYQPAQGQPVTLNNYQALFAVTGSRWGGDFPRTFALPKVTGPWAGVRTGADGDGACLAWSVATWGIFPYDSPPPAYPGQLYFTAVQSRPFHDAMLEAGATVDASVSAFLGEGFTAYRIPDSWQERYVEPMLGELRLFTASTALPRPFVPADGRVVPDANRALQAALRATQLPKVMAPDGYAWAIATDGLFPSQN